ncbi:MAG: cupin domain-containing protein [Legionellaceae bacterium]|nr:cupin domain-containing protein [Legionellaceae bacterium]
MHEWIDTLKLDRHIEGGYFGLVYQSVDHVTSFNERYQDTLTQERAVYERKASSSIYFLLEKHDFSAWHQLKSDEIWHYYDGGSAIDIHTIDQHGLYEVKSLGHPRLFDNASFQVIITAGTWFAAELQNKSSYGLVGCTVSPGFEYQDFTLAIGAELVTQYPEHAAIINRLTRCHDTLRESHG